MITYTARTQNYQAIIQCGKSSIVISLHEIQSFSVNNYLMGNIYQQVEPINSN